MDASVRSELCSNPALSAAKQRARARRKGDRQDEPSLYSRPQYTTSVYQTTASA